MKYLSICRFAKHYISSMLGKLVGFCLVKVGLENVWCYFSIIIKEWHGTVKYI